MKKNIKRLVDRVPIIAIAIDSHRNITYYNNSAKQKFLFLEEGRDINLVLRSTELNTFIDKCFGEEKDYTVEFQPSNFDDWYFLANLLFFSETDHQCEIIIFLTDQTFLYSYEKMRTDFVANVSHELRTPLSSIVGYIETIKNENNLDKKTTNKFLDIMEEQAWRMSRLVEDLLLLSKYEADDKPLDFREIEVVKLVESAIDNLKLKIEEKKLQVVFNNFLNDKIISLNSDSIIQVFINILDNAIKYSNENSSIFIKLNNIILEENNHIHIQIEDQGEGIAKEHLHRLTERFYRIDKNRSRDLGGTGLGLSIVKHIINRHNGKLTISSEPEKGSIFNVYLPIIQK